MEIFPYLVAVSVVEVQLKHASNSEAGRQLQRLFSG